MARQCRNAKATTKAEQLQLRLQLQLQLLSSKKRNTVISAQRVQGKCVVARALPS